MREALGFDARLLTPGMTTRIIFSAAETRSFKRASIVLRHVAAAIVSDDTVQRIVGDVGRELAERRDADPKTIQALAKRPEEPPSLAVVECDGGRARTREPGRGRGVHLSGERGWRETKNACLINAIGKTFEQDPQPEPPACFGDPKHVARIAEAEALSTAKPPAVTPPDDVCESQDNASQDLEDWRPRRRVRTVLSSMQSSRAFGRQMQREARRRRFYEAESKVFLGDGLSWNWSIWNEFFSEFVPVLDFIHPLSYLFLTAKTVFSSSEDDAWSQYLVWMRGCWAGDVRQVLDELKVWQTKIGPASQDAPDTDPRKVIATTINYLNNNRERMKYPEYRKAGFPVTTAWMESLVKEMNYRVKGTEMFWNDPVGAEAILQVRAAALSDDDRLARHLAHRLGSPFTRRPNTPKLPSENCKS